MTPGGVDSHVHLAQDNCPTGDGWETGSRSALAGGNTTLLAFASQNRSDETLFPVLEEYHRRSKGLSYVDYGFHFILTNPTEKILKEEMPVMVEREGITSVKLYMTYAPMKLDDMNLLDVMMAARALGMTTMIHAENDDMINMVTKRLIERGHTIPLNHAFARPQIAEAEATNRAISLAHLTDVPILMVHMSSKVALNHARKAQKALLPIHSETCPHYLFLRSTKLAEQDPHDHECGHWLGAKGVCAPPLRHSEDDLQYIWDSLINGTVTVISSDHAATKYAHSNGKQGPLARAKAAGTTPMFSEIPNGLPGLETRLPLLFHAATSGPGKRAMSLPKFVALTSTNPAKLYGLDGVKGSVVPGYDADLCIWYPEGKGETKIENTKLHHDIDYTPFEGFTVSNWPRYVVLRGGVKWDRDNGGLVGKAGDGEYLKRKKGKVLVGRLGTDVEGMKPAERDFWIN